MGNEDDKNPTYCFNLRYLVEITDDDSGRKYYTKRIGTLPKAVRVAAQYNASLGLTALIFDTKTGETI